MSYSAIPVVYRDASNYKAHGWVAVCGGIDTESLSLIAAELIDGQWFDPVACGWAHLGPALPGFPSVEDHALHELDLDVATLVSEVPEGCFAVVEFGELVLRLRQARLAGF